MNRIDLYEKIPIEKSPIRLLDFSNIEYKFSLHWHEHTEIHYITDGNPLLRVGEELITLSPGDCVVVNSNELHEGIKGKSSYCCLIIPPSFFEYDSIEFKRFIRDNYVGEIISKITEYGHSGAKEASMMVRGYTCLLLGYMTQKYSQNINSSEYKKHLENAEKINDALIHMNNNYADEITTKGLSEMVHLSEGYFCALFKNVTGMSAKEYVLGIRINKAKELLTSTDMSVAEIGYCCGLLNPNYFTRIFRKTVGLTPCEFRKNYDKQKTDSQ